MLNKRFPKIYGIGVDQNTLSHIFSQEVSTTIETHRVACQKLLERVLPGMEKIVEGKLIYYNLLLDGKDGAINTEPSPSFYTEKERGDIAHAKENFVSTLIIRQKEEKRASILKGIQEGTLDLSKQDDLDNVFNRIEVVKIIIFYNNQVIKKKSPFDLVPETGIILEVRRRIETWENEKKKLSEFVRFLKGLEFGSLKTEKDFRKTIENILGYQALDSVDWRDRPFFIQYAVGENEVIPHPYHQSTCLESIKNPICFEKCKEKRYHYIVNWTQEMKSRLTSLSKSLPGLEDLDKESDSPSIG